MYIEYIIKMIPKVLSQVDRDKYSKSYGDCDRNHWHLKVRDFSSAILQQTGLTMALLYTVDFPGNIFYRRKDVKEWAEATVYYWKKIQLRDGSFNEYYPHEHGFPPTAFSLYAMCEVYSRLEMRDNSCVKAFKKTAQFLINHIEDKAYNQEMACVTALYSAYKVTGELWILDGMNKKLDRLLQLQSAEGWFSEYGGADIGYLSVTLDMLAEYYWMSRDEKVIASLNKMVEFVKYFVHPDKTIGGEYASRNTIYFLPNGLQVLACLGNASAESMIDVLYTDTEKEFYFLDAVDDRYFSHYILHSFLRALQKRLQQETTCEKTQLPYMYEQEHFFEEAGLYSKTWENRYAIVGVAKGGVCRVWGGEIPCFNDYGYRVKLDNGKVAVTNWQNGDYVYQKENNHVMVSGYMNIVRQKMPTPMMHLGLRIISAVIGNRIIGFLKNQIILVHKQSDIKFERSIDFQDNQIIIDDIIISPKKIKLECAECYSLRHVASGKFFSVADLAPHSNKVYPNVTNIKIRRIFSFDNGTIEETITENG